MVKPTRTGSGRAGTATELSRFLENRASLATWLSRARIVPKQDHPTRASHEAESEAQRRRQIGRRRIARRESLQAITVLDQRQDRRRIINRLVTNPRFANGEITIVGTRVPGPQRSTLGGGT